jgi:hypothetical protein
LKSKATSFVVRLVENGDIPPGRLLLPGGLGAHSVSRPTQKQKQISSCTPYDQCKNHEAYRSALTPQLPCRGCRFRSESAGAKYQTHPRRAKARGLTFHTDVNVAIRGGSDVVAFIKRYPARATLCSSRMALPMPAVTRRPLAKATHPERTCSPPLRAWAASSTICSRTAPPN